MRPFRAASRIFSEPSTPSWRKGAGQGGAAGVDVVLALLLGDVTADAGAGLAGDDEAFPGGGWGAAAGGEDLDLVAVLQLVAERHEAAVDLGADRRVADLAVDGVGEIDRGGAAGELDELALGREAEDLVLIELELGVLEEVLGILDVVEDFEEVLDPAEFLQVARGCVVLFVEPMGGDAGFGDLVHVGGADLHLDLLVAGLAQGHAGVDGLVAVGLGRADVVFEAAGDDGEGGVDRAQGGVAGVAGRHDDAEGHDVRELFEGDVAALHLLPDGEGGFLAAADADGDGAVVGADANEFAADLLDDVSALAAEEVEAGLDGVEGFGFELGEGEALELGLDGVHADALGERGVDFHRLAGDALAALDFLDVVEGAHVVEAVGEFDEQDTDVLAHGQDELAEVLSLFGAVGLELEAGEFGDAVDEAADGGAEHLVELGAGDAGVFDHIVQQGGDDAGGIEAVAGEDVGDREGVGDVGVAVLAALAAVGLRGEDIGGVDFGDIGGRVVGADFFGQLELANRIGASLLGFGRAGAVRREGGAKTTLREPLHRAGFSLSA